MKINSFKKSFFAVALVVVFLSALTIGSLALAKEDDGASDNNSGAEAISKCLKAWGTHPFGEKPDYKTLSTSVKVFGIGQNPKDSQVTDKPALVLINPAVNVMGGTVYELQNPQGWYCFRANVNVMGGLIIKANCKAHLASSTTGATVMGTDEAGNKGVTVMGTTKVELVGCGQANK